MQKRVYYRCHQSFFVFLVYQRTEQLKLFMAGSVVFISLRMFEKFFRVVSNNSSLPGTFPYASFHNQKMVIFLVSCVCSYLCPINTETFLFWLIYKLNKCYLYVLGVPNVDGLPTESSRRRGNERSRNITMARDKGTWLHYYNFLIKLYRFCSGASRFQTIFLNNRYNLC